MRRIILIERKKIRKLTSEHVMWVSEILLFVLIGIIYFSSLEPNQIIYLIVLVLALIPVLTNIYGNYEYFPEDFMIISQVEINEDKISVNKQEIELNSIRKLEFEIHDWEGKKIVRNLRAYGSGL